MSPLLQYLHKLQSHLACIAEVPHM